MKPDSNVFGIILAGGSGSRLWPLSREMYPKQLLKLTSNYTLLQTTFLRMANICPGSNIITVTNTKHMSDIKIQLEEIKSILELDKFELLAEPLGRNTAPAITLAVFYILKKLIQENSDPIFIVCPSDHITRNQETFTNAVQKSVKLAEAGFIVTLGIKPETPDTGFGYINTQKDDKIAQIESDALKVRKFKEKPDPDTAKRYFNAGTYYWNSGMYIFKASTILNELQLYAKEIVENIINCQFSEVGPTISYEQYEKNPEISIDYAVMEHSSNIALVPLDCGWNDMGSWGAIYDVSEKDNNNNFISGDVIDIDSKNSFIYGTSRLVTTVGLENIVIVETEDAILACNKDKSQDVKKIFESLKQCSSEACITYRTVYRPWGFYTVLQKGEGFLIKTIQVNPKAKLSLQMHHHRSEHWVILSGEAKIVKGDETLFLHTGNTVDIPATTRHSLENVGMIELKILEVQKGDYLDEDDIIRFEDKYGRETQKL